MQEPKAEALTKFRKKVKKKICVGLVTKGLKEQRQQIILSQYTLLPLQEFIK